jgi:ABC-type uncharacterized transport system substrate-binding protein
VEFNLVASFNRPGGNVTGARWLGISLAAKQLELLHEVTPKSARNAANINQRNPASDSVAKDLEQAARLLGLQIGILNASNDAQHSSNGVLASDRIAGLANDHRRTNVQVAFVSDKRPRSLLLLIAIDRASQG